MRDYHNEGDLDGLISPMEIARAELKDLFGLYPTTKNVNSVIKFVFKILPDLKAKEIEKFCSHWAGSDKNCSPDHKEIKKYILSLRLRGVDIKEFEPSEICFFDICNGSGIIECHKDNYRYIYKCKCNSGSELPEIKDVSIFDKVYGIKA